MRIKIYSKSGFCNMMYHEYEMARCAMRKFKIPKPPVSVTKSVRFPETLVAEVEEAIRGTDCTFSAFVVEATQFALENMQEDEKKWPNPRGARPCGRAPLGLKERRDGNQRRVRTHPVPSLHRLPAGIRRYSHRQPDCTLSRISRRRLRSFDKWCS